MGSVIVYCHYCNAKLDVDDSWIGQEIKCPVCHRLIMIKNNEMPDPPELPEAPLPPAPTAPEQIPDEAEKKHRRTAAAGLYAATVSSPQKRYFWGMLGVKSARFIAVIMLLSGGFFSWELWRNYCYKVAVIPEKIALDNNSKKFRVREKDLNAEFLNTITLLNGRGRINNGVMDGMDLAAAAGKRPSPMPFNIDSSSAVMEAEAVLKQYVTMTGEIKKEFVRNFGRLLNYIAPQPERKSTNDNGKNDIVVTTGGSQRQFYAGEKYKQQQLELLQTMLDKLQRKSSDQPETARRLDRSGLNRSQAAAKFVERRLFSQGANTTVVRGSRQKQSTGDNRDQLTDEVLDIYSLIIALSRDWKLDRRIAEMQILLSEIKNDCKIFEQKRRFLQQELLGSIIRLWLSVLASAFALMIFADFLRAHFEVADLLHKKSDLQQ